jgi:hypothetical protein
MDAKPHSGLPHLLSEAMDDERLYHSRFRADSITSEFEPSPDELEEELRKEAKRIEDTVGCVTAVVRTKSGKLGMTQDYDIVLYAILPRSTDKELFEHIVQESRHRMLNRLHG